MMINARDKILSHYNAKHDEYVPMVGIKDDFIVYSVSFMVGRNVVNKIGMTGDVNRYRKMIHDVREMYNNVSVGSFIVHQEIHFTTEKLAKDFETEALNNLVHHTNYKKCKIYFNGHKEAYF